MPKPTIVTVTLVALSIELIASILSFYVYARLSRLSRLLDDKALSLAALGFLVYAIALTMEALGNIYALASLHRPPTHPYTGETRRLTELLLNRGSITALPVYTVSYVLLAASIYVEHVKLPPATQVLVPVFLSLYIDQNMVNLLVLLATASLTLAHYGRARLGGLLFYTLTGTSHLAALIAIATPEHWHSLVVLGMILRSLAVPAFLAASNRGGQQ